MKRKRVPFFKWFYHSLFHKGWIESVNEITLQHHCSCGISWREKKIKWFNV